MDTQPDTTEIIQRTATIVAKAHEMVVDSADSYEEAGACVTRIPPVLKMIEALFGPGRDDIFQAHKRACARISELKSPLEIAKRIYGDKMLAHRQVEEARAAKEQARLQAEAREREEEQRLAEAEELEKRGKIEEAQAAIDRPITPYVPTVEPKTPKVPGVSVRKLPWRWRLLDVTMVPHEYFMLDEKKINGVVRSMGAQTSIPGIEVYQPETMAIGGR